MFDRHPLRLLIFSQRVCVAEHNTRKLLIEELLNRTRLEQLLHRDDSDGNYCVQVFDLLISLDVSINISLDCPGLRGIPTMRPISLCVCVAQAYQQLVRPFVLCLRSCPKADDEDIERDR